MARSGPTGDALVARRRRVQGFGGAATIARDRRSGFVAGRARCDSRRARSRASSTLSRGRGSSRSFSTATRIATTRRRKSARWSSECTAARTPRSSELARGRDTLRRSFGERFAAVLVPPWNRIGDAIVARLPDIGLRGLSTFGPRKAPFRRPDSCNAIRTSTSSPGSATARSSATKRRSIDWLRTCGRAATAAPTRRRRADRSPHASPGHERRMLGIRRRARCAHARAAAPRGSTSRPRSARSIPRCLLPADQHEAHVAAELVLAGEEHVAHRRLLPECREIGHAIDVLAASEIIVGLQRQQLSVRDSRVPAIERLEVLAARVDDELRRSGGVRAACVIVDRACRRSPPRTFRLARAYR